MRPCPVAEAQHEVPQARRDLVDFRLIAWPLGTRPSPAPSEGRAGARAWSLPPWRFLYPSWCRVQLVRPRLTQAPTAFVNTYALALKWEPAAMMRYPNRNPNDDQHEPALPAFKLPLVCCYYLSS